MPGDSIVHVLIRGDKSRLEENSKKLQWLIDAGADLNQVDANGNSPLMIAIRWYKYDLGIILIEAGADWEKRHNSLGIPAVVQLLLERSPVAAENVEPYRRMIETLKKKGADFDEAQAYKEFYEKESVRLFGRSKEEREKITNQIVKEYKKFRQKQSLETK